LDSLARAADRLEAWGSSLLATVAVSGREPRLRDRLESQLRFRLNPAWRAAIDPFVRSVTLTSSDPFFREGHDVTAILELKGGESAASAADLVARLAREAGGVPADATASERTFAGVAVHGISTPDRRVSSLVASVGPYLVISNSRAAMDAVLDTMAGGRRSLPDAPDFRYMPPPPGPAADEHRLPHP